MKKAIKSISALMLAATMVLSLNSCKKDDKDSPTASLGTATISGRITVDKDVNDNTAVPSTYQNPMAGITVIARISSEDLTLNQSQYWWNNNLNYPYKTYTAVTDAAGNYTLTVDVADQQLYVYVKANDFTYDQIQSPVAPATTGVAQRTKGYGSWFSNSYNVYKGSVFIYDMNY